MILPHKWDPYRHEGTLLTLISSQISDPSPVSHLSSPKTQHQPSDFQVQKSPLHSFTKLTRFVPDQHPPHPQPHHPYRVITKQRSDLAPSLAGFLSEAWHLEPNTHENGVLKNAVDNMGDRLCKKVWVGTLRTVTDGFSDSSRKNIDQRMWTQRSSCQS